MSRLLVYDHESIRELLVPHFTMTACRRFIEREYPRYGSVIVMSYEALGRLGVVHLKTTNATLLFIGMAIEFIQDRGLMPG